MPTGNLPAEGKKLFERVYEEAKKGSTCKDQGDRRDECAARIAWTAVKNAGWKKDADGNWHKSETLSEFSLRIERASYDKATNQRRWRAVASDTDEDSRRDSMSDELFQDFLNRIVSKEPVPEQYQTEFWKGGMPYLSVSHYPDLNGEGIPGDVEVIYIDGSYLKAKGLFNDTPLGRKCFEAVCSDLYSEKSDSSKDKVRISIAFLDWKHKHKDTGWIFTRGENADGDICPECLKEMITGKSSGKVFMNGHLVHLAMTRVPVNKRTDMEVDKSMADIKTRKDDAASIVGDELAEELEEKAKLVGKSETLVIKSEESQEEVQEEAKTKVTVVPMTDDDEDEECDDEVDEGCGKKKEVKSEAVSEESDIIEEAKQKTEQGKKYPASDYLVAEDPSKPSTWHLQVKRNGKPDHGLMGAAKAALTSPGGHRGNKYEGPKKAEATAKLKRLYASEKMEWTSEVEESEMINKDELISIIKSTIAEEIQLVVKPVEATLEVSSHPLDKAFETFRAEFDKLESIDGEDNKLIAIQNPFNVLGQAVVDVVKSTVKKVEQPIAPMSVPTADLATSISKAITDAMQPFAQKLDMVSAQLQTNVSNRIPQRRSIDPATVPQDKQPVVKSSTPKLRAVIEKTTY